MEEDDKLPFKRVELSLSKFNEVAIPHHLDLLRQHKANILKYSELGEYARVRAEQSHALRVSSQLRSLLGELDSLRRRVREQDLPRFDQATQRSRDDTLRAIVGYLGMIESSCKAIIVESKAQTQKRETSPLAINRQWAERPVSGSAVSTDSVGVVAHAEPGALQLQVDESEPSIEEREALLRGWSALQSEVRALHDVWTRVHHCARAQAAQVDATASSVDVAAVNVEQARKHLALAERMRVGAYSIGGAAIGALVGGPAGLLVGAKAGAAAALAGSLLGFCAGRALRPALAPKED